MAQTDLQNPSLLNPFHPAGGIPAPSRYRPFSRSHTTYAGMTDWCGKAGPGSVPVTLSDANWRKHQVQHSNAHPQHERPYTMGGPKPADEFERAFLELSKNVAYRFPNPGMPQERQGRHGSNWRNIKEVLGYGGSQICFVDGLVRQYDTDKFTQYLATGGRVSRMLPMKPRQTQTPTYALNRHNISSWRRDLKRELDMKTYKPWYKEANHLTDRQLPALYEAQPPVGHPTKPHTAGGKPTSPTKKYKGMYQLK